jgi:hypothetical protein
MEYFFSTADGRWFVPQPALTFDAPARGYCEVNDLNGDGLAEGALIPGRACQPGKTSIRWTPNLQPKEIGNG